MSTRLPARWITVSIENGPACIAVRIAPGIRWRTALPEIRRLAQNEAQRRVRWAEIFVFESPFDSFFYENEPKEATRLSEREWLRWKWRNTGFEDGKHGKPLAFPLYEINVGGTLKI